ncbi:MAG TPA: ABC transporter permease, partial [Bryobacteraceae bacterium]|nr:ABC transporter permease [Bryobacteraceae bacterium]
MFLRFVLRAVEHRKQRLLLALAALSVAAPLATVLFAIYGTVERRIRDEFRSYGANIVATPALGNTLPLNLAAAAEKLGAEAAPWLVTPGAIEGVPLTVAGFDPATARSMTAYWHVEGTREIAPGDCLAGESIAAQFNLKPGAKAALEGAPCTVKGIVSTGGAEDNELLVPLATATTLAAL